MSTHDTTKAWLILNRLQPGMAAWPETEPLESEFGFRIHGRYFGPGDEVRIASLCVATYVVWLLSAIPVTAYLLKVLFDINDWSQGTDIMVRGAGAALTAAFTYYVLMPLMSGKVEVTITDREIRVKQRSVENPHEPREVAIPRDGPVPLLIRKERHGQVTRDEPEDRRSAPRYRQTYEVVIRYLERRFVVASIQNDEARIDALLTRLQVLDSLASTVAGAPSGERQ